MYRDPLRDASPFLPEIGGRFLYRFNLSFVSALEVCATELQTVGPGRTNVSPIANFLLINW